MPMPIPDGKQIIVQKNSRPGGYCMPSMQMATDHYDISYIITGDRKAITPLKSYNYHTGDIAMGEPYLYHRTMSESGEPYKNYLIKFTPDFIEPFIKHIGKNIFDELIKQRICHFTEPIRKKVEIMFEEMLQEYNKNKCYKEIILQGMLNRLLAFIYENKLDSYAANNKSPLTKPVMDAVYYIDKNYNKKITIRKLSEKTHFSDSHFSKMFSRQLGVSVTEYISNVRIGYAKRLLIQSDKSVMEIALDIGYCDGDYLSAKFKNKTGMTPMEFRRKNRNL